MRSLKYICLGILTLFVCWACNEEEFLEEETSGVFTGNNMFITADHFASATYLLYDQYRGIYYKDQNHSFDFLYGTDLAHNGEGKTNIRFGEYTAALDPTGSVARTHWRWGYLVISKANTILDRLPDSELSDAEQLEFEAVAKFFRAQAYMVLTYLYGSVPLLLKEATGPQVDFTRNTREECLNQVISDLEFAAANLPGIAEVRDGEVSNAAANHVLADASIAAGEYDKAIAAATAVIDDPNLALMTERFGSRMSEPGDVIWDLYRRGNQNRASGNTEGILVIQFELDVPGGSSISTNREGSFKAERLHAPFTREIKRPDDRSVKAGFLWPVGDYTGGRGIGWIIPTYHFTNTIWEDDEGNIDMNDLRTSEYNLPRSYAYNNPDGDYPLGTMFDVETNPEAVFSLETTGLWPRSIYPYSIKVTTPFNQPEGVIRDPETLLLHGTAGATFTDWYDMRLAETYLLRAEAYLMKGDQTSAAIDINTIRSRANAAPVSPSDVDIDYILDERLRELGIEEKRRLTLSRLGKLYERVTTYNHYNAGDIQPHHELFPVPQSEIEANTEAELTQNPGY